MVEINVERENPRSHNPRSYNPIGSTVSLCAAYQSALACDIGFHSKLCISPLYRVFCQCVYPLPWHLLQNPIHNSGIYEIQTCALSILTLSIQFTILFLLSLLSRIHYSLLSRSYTIFFLPYNATSIATYFVILRVSY